MFRPFLCAAALAGGLAAQQVMGPHLPPQPPVVVDQVLATVNDSEILASELRSIVMSRITAAEAQRGQRLNNEERDRLVQEELTRLIDKHTLAQAAKSLGSIPPDRIEQWFQDELRRDEDEQVRNLGSLQEFSRELQRQGRTWQTHERVLRTQKMAEIAEDFAVWGRLQKQGNLFLTPRMLRETYERDKAYFVRDAQAAVAIVTFLGDDAATKAAAAAELWRQQSELSPRDLADRFPGAVFAGMMDAKEVSLPELTRFALAGPLGAVSAPLPAGRAVQLAKITAFVPARNGRFEDPDVQAELQRSCMNQVLAEFRQQAQLRARDRTYVWSRLGSR